MLIKPHIIKCFSTLCIVLGLLPWTAQAAIDFRYHIEGLPSPILSNTERLIEAAKQNDLATITPETAQAFYEKIPMLLQQGIRPYGYFNANITSNLLTQDDHWQANFHVNLGPITTIKSLHTEITGPGKDNHRLNKTLAVLPLQENNPLQVSDYEETKKLLIEKAIGQGYLDAHFTKSKIKVMKQNNSAEITLIMETGARYTLGYVSFPDTKLQPKVLRRLVPFHEGDIYSPRAINKLQSNLSKSGYFENITVIPLKNQAQDNRVPITVELTPRKNQQYFAAAGYGTDTGARGRLGWEVRRLNSHGDHLNTYIKASEIQDSAAFSYIIPGHFPLTDHYALTGKHTEEHPEPGGFSRTNSIGLSSTKQIKKWYSIISLDYQREDYKVTDADPKRNSQLLIPSAKLSWSNIKNPFYARDGGRIELIVRGASEQLLSDTNFLQGEIHARYLQPLSPKNTLSVKTQIGATAITEIDKLPLSLRYYAGGNQSIRGYEYQDLGPGRYLFTTSLEMQRKIVDNWYGLLFYDTGNAFNHIDAGLKESIGIGVLWQTPIGPVELTVARTLGSDSHYGIGFDLGPTL